jgi:DNA-binding XRE family transcriptional regulator
MSAHETMGEACTRLRPKSIGVHAGQVSGIQPARRTILCVYPAALQGAGPSACCLRAAALSLLNWMRDARDVAVSDRTTPQPEPRNPSTALHRLGATIRQYRRYRGLTQRALAERTGLNVTYLGEIERGVRNLSVLTLLRIADALQLRPSRFLRPFDTPTDGTEKCL